MIFDLIRSTHESSADGKEVYVAYIYIYTFSNIFRYEPYD